MSPSKSSPCTEKDLEAPLLEEETDNLKEVSLYDSNADEEASVELPVQTRTRLNVLSVGTGVFVGLISQVILTACMWDNSLLDRSMREILVFSMIWSVVSCLLVNFSMAIFLHDMKASFYRAKDEDDESVWNKASSTMEAYVIGGAGLAVTIWWLTLNSEWWTTLHIGRAALPLSTSETVVFLIAATILYIFFMALVMPCRSGAPAWWHCLIASILGLVIGFGSQSGLSAFFWAGILPKPAPSSLLVFSMAWTGFTIGLTFLGHVALRSLKPSSSSNGSLAAERAYLRMESFYVLCSLVGICFAWTSLDVLLGLKQQIVPSLLMLLFSLMLFRVILYCFPEEKCLEEYEQENKAKATSSKELLL